VSSDLRTKFALNSFAVANNSDAELPTSCLVDRRTNATNETTACAVHDIAAYFIYCRKAAGPANSRSQHSHRLHNTELSILRHFAIAPSHRLAQ